VNSKVTRKRSTRATQRLAQRTTMGLSWKQSARKLPKRGRKMMIERIGKSVVME
jgi:hypothetical protein